MMEGEFRNLIIVSLIVSVSLTYCYFVSSRIPRGKKRLQYFLPIISIFFLLPLLFSSVFFQFHTGLIIAWFANFKLLLIALSQDDSITSDPSVSLPQFILLTALPITRKNPTKKYVKEKEIKTSDTNTGKNFAANLIMWFVLVLVYSKKHPVLVNYPTVRNFLYNMRVGVTLQFVFGTLAAVAKTFVQYELEPQFKDPFFPTSVQDYWGKRWNLMASSILRSTVYVPTRSFTTPILGRRLGMHVALLATFTASGFMHEVFYFYVTRTWPSWEVMWCFVINGIWVAIEIEIKKKTSRMGWNLDPKISIPLATGFLAISTTWLACTELIDVGADVREIEELYEFTGYVKRMLCQNKVV